MTPKTAIPSEPFGERGIGLSERVMKSLPLQLFCAVLISLLVGCFSFAASFFLGNALLDRTVYGNTFSETMAQRRFFQLQEFVKTENISLDNLQRLNVWCSRGDKVYLTLYRDDDLIYESPISGRSRSRSEMNLQEYHPDLEDPENRHTLTLQGDVTVRAFLYYYAGDTFYYGLLILSGLISFLTFSLCFITLISWKVSYITLLKQELDILSGGQLEYAVTIHGTDELGELAAGIDQMRRSIVKHQEMEQKIRTANSELITAISHDLRTPLTSLLAYLEIIERKKYTDEAQMYELVHKSIGQTMRIKNMADKLFEYFLAYATEWESSDPESVDADMLFLPILEDYAYSLESRGVVVEKEFLEVSGMVNVNTELLQRALDNLYSNLLKYADPGQPICMRYRREDNRFCLTIANGISADQNRKESTSIGLKTCRRIIEFHGGTFTTTETPEKFTVQVVIPLQ